MMSNITPFEILSIGESYDSGEKEEIIRCCIQDSDFIPRNGAILGGPVPCVIPGCSSGADDLLSTITRRRAK